MTDLITRLEEAAEGSRELDREMALATGVLLTGIKENGEWGVKEGRWTQSLDAALALAERLDPGNGWERLYSGLMNWRAFTPAGLKRLPCLVCAAILKANHKDKP